MATTMKAAVYHEFGGPISIEDVPKPSIRRRRRIDGADGGVDDDDHSHRVIIKIMATGICRSDYHGWKGHDTDIIEHGLPFVPGHECSGYVVQVGSKVQTLTVGDRVVVPFIWSCGTCRYCVGGGCNSSGRGSTSGIRPQPTICKYQRQPGFTQWGSYAEYLSVSWADRNLRKLPSNVSYIQAAALGCRFTTAYRAIIQQGKFEELIASSSSPSSIAIFGCGGLGLSCIMIAVAAIKAQVNERRRRNSRLNGGGDSSCDCRIIAIDISTEALEMAKSLGATHTVLIPKGSDGSNSKSLHEIVKQKVCSLTYDNDGADITVDAAGFPSTSEYAVHCARPGGTMVQVGLPISGEGGGSSNNNNNNGDHASNKNHGNATTMAHPIIPMGRVAGKELQIIGSHGFDAADFPQLLDMVSSGVLDPSQLVTREVTLEEGCTILQTMEYTSPVGINVITKFNNDDLGSGENYKAVETETDAYGVAASTLSSSLSVHLPASRL